MRNVRGGRHPDWLREECKNLVSKYNLVKFYAEVAQGKVEGATVADRMRAIGELMDRGWGKPTQSMEHSGKDGGEIKVKLINYEY